MYVHTYTKLPDFIQLSQTFTELRHIKRDHLVHHLVNFYISVDQVSSSQPTSSVRALIKLKTFAQSMIHLWKQKQVSILVSVKL